MKTQLCQVALVIISTAVTSSPTLAQSPAVAFYCGRTTQNEYATKVQVKGSERDQTIVVWKDGLRNMSAKKRCDIVSEKFQTAWKRSNFRLVPRPEPKTGRGILCALLTEKQVCQDKDILFSVNNAAQADSIVADLYRAMSPKVSRPIYQSSSAQSIDMQELIKSISESAEK
ncbi:COP23 domain-containing protein [Chamaesiphon sp.]|uniref:COP23 domain-containing protein n=1 Tax=Chamaesiphon sp. TaxID=2814140 RepID=UPI0035940626